MTKEIDEKLDNLLDINSDIKQETKLVKVPTREKNIETDYRYARENLYDLVERGQDAIDGILELSKETEHPRAYEVAGQLIKTVSETAERLSVSVGVILTMWLIWYFRFVSPKSTNAK